MAARAQMEQVKLYEFSFEVMESAIVWSNT